MGGTFNPIHNGHIMALHALTESSVFDEVWLMPSGMPPYKQAEYQSVDDRFNMARLVTAELPGLVLREDERYGDQPSYTYNTLQTLAKAYPSNTFYWTIGYDNLETIEGWKDGTKLLSEYGIVLMNRGGYNVQKAREKIQYIRESYASHIIEIDMPVIEIASTDIRRRIAMNQSIMGYCPKCVIDYINKQQLYQAVRNLN